MMRRFNAIRVAGWGFAAAGIYGLVATLSLQRARR